jgi:DNA primase
MIKQEIIDAVRDRTDIVALIGESVRLVKKGRTWKGCCPFHKEKTPSFHVSPDKGFAFCHGCKKSCDAIDFVQETEGLTFVEAVRMLAERLGLEVEETRSLQERQEAAAAKDQREAVYRANEIAALWFEQNLWDGDVPAGIPLECRLSPRCEPSIGVANAWAELDKRGLAPTNGEHKLIGATLRAFRLGYAPPFWDHLLKHLVQGGISPVVAEQAGLIGLRQSGSGHYDRFRNRLMFAVVDVQGRVVGFSGRMLPLPQGGDAAACNEPAKYVNTPESHVYTKGKNLFGLWQAKTSIRRADEGILVEGNFDVVSLHARGIDNVVAPLGTAFTEVQAALLKRFGARHARVRRGHGGDEGDGSVTRSLCERGSFRARRVAPRGDGSRRAGARTWRRWVSATTRIVMWAC